jgi:hypothetical protein
MVGLINPMRLFAPTEVVDGAEAVVRPIVEILLKPSIEVRQLAKEALSKHLDPDPIGKSRACRDREDAVCSGRQRALLGRQLQAVADPELGQDVSRTGRIGFDLLPQPANEHPKILHFLGLCRAPHLA